MTWNGPNQPVNIRVSYTEFHNALLVKQLRAPSHEFALDSLAHGHLQLRLIDGASSVWTSMKLGPTAPGAALFKAPERAGVECVLRDSTKVLDHPLRVHLVGRDCVGSAPIEDMSSANVQQSKTLWSAADEVCFDGVRFGCYWVVLTDPREPLPAFERTAATEWTQIRQASTRQAITLDQRERAVVTLERP
jgi:hypothetical protein